MGGGWGGGGVASRQYPDPLNRTLALFLTDDVTGGWEKVEEGPEAFGGGWE